MQNEQQKHGHKRNQNTFPSPTFILATMARSLPGVEVPTVLVTRPWLQQGCQGIKLQTEMFLPDLLDTWVKLVSQIAQIQDTVFRTLRVSLLLWNCRKAWLITPCWVQLTIAGITKPSVLNALSSLQAHVCQAKRQNWPLAEACLAGGFNTCLGNPNYNGPFSCSTLNKDILPHGGDLLCLKDDQRSRFDDNGLWVMKWAFYYHSSGCSYRPALASPGVHRQHILASMDDTPLFNIDIYTIQSQLLALTQKPALPLCLCWMSNTTNWKQKQARRRFRRSEHGAPRLSLHTVFF